MTDDAAGLAVWLPALSKSTRHCPGDESGIRTRSAYHSLDREFAVVKKTKCFSSRYRSTQSETIPDEVVAEFIRPIVIGQPTKARERGFPAEQAADIAA